MNLCRLGHGLEAPKPLNEEQRLQALKEYEVLDTAPETVFDDIARIAAQVCGTPIALVSLVDEHRQWFKARVGMEETETPREVAFCAHAILDHRPLVVPDATQDERFADNPLVTEESHLRFYAGAPLLAPGGLGLGTLCVIDREPRDLPVEQLEALEALARQTVRLLEYRKVSDRLAKALRKARVLSELIPICSYCRRIRDDGDFWSQLEHYLAEHTGSILSHGVCPDCEEVHFPVAEVAAT